MIQFELFYRKKRCGKDGNEDGWKEKINKRVRLSAVSFTIATCRCVHFITGQLNIGLGLRVIVCMHMSCVYAGVCVCV